jgi:hypothetical protein
MCNGAISALFNFPLEYAIMGGLGKLGGLDII